MASVSASLFRSATAPAHRVPFAELSPRIQGMPARDCASETCLSRQEGAHREPALRAAGLQKRGRRRKNDQTGEPPRNISCAIGQRRLVSGRQGRRGEGRSLRYRSAASPANPTRQQIFARLPAQFWLTLPATAFCKANLRLKRQLAACRDPTRDRLVRELALHSLPQPTYLPACAAVWRPWREIIPDEGAGLCAVGPFSPQWINGTGLSGLPTDPQAYYPVPVRSDWHSGGGRRGGEMKGRTWCFPSQLSRKLLDLCSTAAPVAMRSGGVSSACFGHIRLSICGADFHCSLRALAYATCLCWVSFSGAFDPVLPQRPGGAY